MNVISGVVGELKRKGKPFDALDYKIIALNCIALCFGIFFSRCGIKNVIYPFGAAYFVCMLCFSSYYKAAYFGCIIGSISLYPNINYGSILICTACISIVFLLRKKFKFTTNRIIKIIFVTFSILNIFIFWTNISYFMIMGICETIVGILSFFIFEKCANILYARKKRQALTDEEAICVVFCLCSVVIATGNIKVSIFSLCYIIACFITILFAFMFGGLVGGTSGLIMGLCVSFGTGNIYIIGTLGVCGFVSGVFKRYTRYASMIAFVCANALLTFYINGSSLVILPIQNTAVACVTLACIPPKYMEKIKGILCQTVTKSKEEKYYLEKCNSLARNRLENISNLFSNMSDVFFEKDYAMPNTDISNIVSSVSEVTCKNCKKYDNCWKNHHTFVAFENMVMKYTEKGNVDGIKFNCIKKDLVLKTLVIHLKDMERQEMYNKKVDESRKLVSNQLQGVSNVLLNLVDELDSDIKFEKDIEKGIKEDLILKNIIVYDVCCVTSHGSKMCEVVVGGCNGDCNCKSVIKDIVSKYCDKNMVLNDNLCMPSKNKKCTLYFRESRPIRVFSSVSQFAKDSVCGDSFKVSYVNDKKYMMVLSDGMGSGYNAKAQSNSCIALLDDFFKAGFRENVVFDTVNKLMVIKNQDDMFATVDMCMVDLTYQKLQITKIGAVPSFIFRKGGGLEIIKCHSLPIGIIDDITPQIVTKDINDGDILVMMTDGVFDAFGGIENIQKVDNIIRNELCDDLNKTCDNLIKKAKIASNKIDDMTILISMFKKQKIR